MPPNMRGRDNPSYKHGLADTPIHKIWIDMRQRCENPNRHNYKHYGGRGIKVCERWQVFENFLADMGNRPPGLTLERINTNGDYEPGNCKWATIIEQRNNMRSNHWITIDGTRKTIGTWAKERGWDERFIRMRLRRGMSERDAVMRPKNPMGVRFS